MRADDTSSIPSESAATTELDDTDPVDPFTQSASRLVYRLLVAEELLIGGLHLDVRNTELSAVQVIGSTDDADFSGIFEIVVIRLTFDDGDGAVVGRIVVVGPCVVAVSDYQVSVWSPFDAIIDIATDTVLSHVRIVSTCCTDKERGRQDSS